METNAKFKHDAPCRDSGCPGHEMKLVAHRNKDDVEVFIDGEEVFTGDFNTWDTLLELLPNVR